LDENKKKEIRLVERRHRGKKEIIKNNDWLNDQVDERERKKESK
jgi:hypothetical protein